MSSRTTPVPIRSGQCDVTGLRALPGDRGRPVVSGSSRLDRDPGPDELLPPVDGEPDDDVVTVADGDPRHALPHAPAQRPGVRVAGAQPKLEVPAVLAHRRRRPRRTHPGTTRLTSGLPLPNGCRVSSASAVGSVRSRTPTTASTTRTRARVIAGADRLGRRGEPARNAGDLGARPAAARPRRRGHPTARASRSPTATSAWRSTPGRLRPEPLATSPSIVTTIAGRPNRSTSREATMPTTPSCQPSPATTIAYASRDASGEASMICDGLAA